MDTEQVNFRPELVAPSAWIAPSATVTADVELGEEVSIWFGAVLRGDADVLRVGNGSNIQDLSCLHADPGYPCILGERVTVGHGAVVHGAEVEDEVLIGIKAVVLTGAKIGKHSIIGAGALVREGQVVPPRSLVVGVPAKVIREVNQDEINRIVHGAHRYIENGKVYRKNYRSSLY